jgi:hypothetical protein
MPTMHRRCAHPGCDEPARGGRCQDCGKRFCAAHVNATDFIGVRRAGAPQTSWTRYVCPGCVGRATRSLLDTTAMTARDQAARDERGYWWTEGRPPA